MIKSLHVPSFSFELVKHFLDIYMGGPPHSVYCDLLCANTRQIVAETTGCGEPRHREDTISGPGTFVPASIRALTTFTSTMSDDTRVKNRDPF